MRTITANISLTLDGVMQAPAAADEDTRGGFKRGGWALPYNDPVMMAEMGKGMAREGAMLFGHRTYNHLYKTWHGRTDNPFSAVLEKAEKYVVSKKATGKLAWANSTLLVGDAVKTVARLKKEDGKDLTVLGSGKLLRALMGHDLVDTFVLLIHPLVLGEGQTLFAGDDHLFKLKLAKTVSTSKGVIIATYQRE